jgi:hypothetical protein
MAPLRGEVGFGSEVAGGLDITGQRTAELCPNYLGANLCRSRHGGLVRAIPAMPTASRAYAVTVTIGPIHYSQSADVASPVTNGAKTGSARTNTNGCPDTARPATGRQVAGSTHQEQGGPVSPYVRTVKTASGARAVQTCTRLDVGPSDGL